MTSPHRIAWAKGGEAFVVVLAGDAISLRSSIPSPPGSRIHGALTVAVGEEGPADEAVVRVKVHSSKRQEDGTFLLEGRVLDMTRAVRVRLTSRAPTD